MTISRKLSDLGREGAAFQNLSAPKNILDAQQGKLIYKNINNKQFTIFGVLKIIQQQQNENPDSLILAQHNGPSRFRSSALSCSPILGTGLSILNPNLKPTTPEAIKFMAEVGAVNSHELGPIKHPQ